jgi:selenocysteine lyase/cysteine desulfurase
MALEELPNLDHFHLKIDSRLKELRQELLVGLAEIPHMHILEPKQPKNMTFISSIISFHITKDGEDLGERVKQNLSIPHATRTGVGAPLHPHYDKKPITIPSKVQDRQLSLLRISLDPHKVSTMEGYKAYTERLQYVLARMKREVQCLLDSSEEKS